MNEMNKLESSWLRRALDARPLRVSFEFFPPKSAQATESLWQTIRHLEPLRPALRLRDVWRRGIDKGEDPGDRQAHRKRDEPQARLAPHLRRRDARERRCRHSRLLGSGHPPHRGAARRPPRRRGRALRAPPRWLYFEHRVGCGNQAHRTVRNLGRLLSGAASRRDERRGEPRLPEAQDRRRRRTAASRSSFTAKSFSCAFSTRPAGPASKSPSCPVSCRSETSRMSAASPRWRAPACPTGCTSSATASTMIPTR